MAILLNPNERINSLSDETIRKIARDHEQLRSELGNAKRLISNAVAQQRSTQKTELFLVTSLADVPGKLQPAPPNGPITLGGGNAHLLSIDGRAPATATIQSNLTVVIPFLNISDRPIMRHTVFVIHYDQRSGNFLAIPPRTVQPLAFAHRIRFTLKSTLSTSDPFAEINLPVDEFFCGFDPQDILNRGPFLAGAAGGSAINVLRGINPQANEHIFHGPVGAVGWGTLNEKLDLPAPGGVGLMYGAYEIDMMECETPI